MPKPEAIPAAVKSLIQRTIDSVGCLEVLLLLRKSATEEWTEDRVSAELRSNPNSARMHLRHMVDHGIATYRTENQKEFYAYAPSTSELAAAIDELATQYHSHRVTVIGLIYERDDSIREFSDAFKLRKD